MDNNAQILSRLGVIAGIHVERRLQHLLRIPHKAAVSSHESHPGLKGRSVSTRRQYPGFRSRV
jgi:hypothetical protein